jgi:protease I
MKAIILTWEGYKDYEAIYPYYRLLEEDWDVTVIANTKEKVKGILGGSIPCNETIECLNDSNYYKKLLNDNSLLILPGGVTSLEKLRLVKPAVRFVADWVESQKLLGSICSGAQMLISAKVLRGRKISAYYSMEEDVVNAGATFIDAPVVIDDNIVTSPHYKWVGKWMQGVLDTYRKNKELFL